MLGLGKYLTAALGGLALLGLIGCGILWAIHRGDRERIIGLEAQLEACGSRTEACAADMIELRAATDERNRRAAEWRSFYDRAAGAIEEANRRASETDAARLAAIKADRDQLAARLAGLPLCDSYLVTLLAIAGEVPP